MTPQKSYYENLLFNTYKKWLSVDGLIPKAIVENYKTEVRQLKIDKAKLNKTI